MLELFYISLRILFLLSALFLCIYFLMRGLSKDNFETVWQGLKDALKGCGLHFGKDTYSIELYKWVIVKEGEICDECLEKSSWPARDIADWLKEGVPTSPTPFSECQGECRCELVLVKTIHVPKDRQKI